MVVTSVPLAVVSLIGRERIAGHVRERILLTLDHELHQDGLRIRKVFYGILAYGLEEHPVFRRILRNPRNPSLERNVRHNTGAMLQRLRRDGQCMNDSGLMIATACCSGLLVHCVRSGCGF